MASNRERGIEKRKDDEKKEKGEKGKEKDMVLSETRTRLLLIKYHSDLVEKKGKSKKGCKVKRSES